MSNVATFKDEQNVELSPSEKALDHALNGNGFAADTIAACMASLLYNHSTYGRATSGYNTMWSEQGEMLRSVANAAYRKLNTMRTYTKPTGEVTQLGARALYETAKKATDIAEEQNRSDEISTQALDQAKSKETERRLAVARLQEIVQAFGNMFEAVSGRAYEPWMPEGDKVAQKTKPSVNKKAQAKELEELKSNRI
tara:strand:- start:335 stop:925 length:591 start_codon:yes stop_codon:yes gene_type:complete